MEPMEKNQLQNLQNRAARILTSSRHDTDARPLLNTLGLKTIQDLIDTEINTMVFKALNGLAPEYLSNLFIKNSESHLLALRIPVQTYNCQRQQQQMGRSAFPTEV